MARSCKSNVFAYIYICYFFFILNTVEIFSAEKESHVGIDEEVRVKRRERDKSRHCYGLHHYLIILHIYSQIPVNFSAGTNVTTETRAWDQKAFVNEKPYRHEPPFHHSVFCTLGSIVSEWWKRQNPGEKKIFCTKVFTLAWGSFRLVWMMGTHLLHKLSPEVIWCLSLFIYNATYVLTNEENSIYKSYKSGSTS